MRVVLFTMFDFARALILRRGEATIGQSPPLGLRSPKGASTSAFSRGAPQAWICYSLFPRIDLHRFVKLLIARLLLRDAEHQRQRVNLNERVRRANKAWHGVKLERLFTQRSVHSRNSPVGVRQRTKVR